MKRDYVDIFTRIRTYNIQLRIILQGICYVHIHTIIHTCIHNRISVCVDIRDHHDHGWRLRLTWLMGIKKGTRLDRSPGTMDLTYFCSNTVQHIEQCSNERIFLRLYRFIYDLKRVIARRRFVFTNYILFSGQIAFATHIFAANVSQSNSNINIYICVGTCIQYTFYIHI